MTAISPSLVASIGKAYPKQVDYILLPDEAIAKMPENEQAMVRNAQEGIRRARAVTASDLSKLKRTPLKPITNPTPEQKAQIYRPKNNGGGNFSFLKPTKFEANTFNLANIQNIPADQLDNRISFVTNGINNGDFKGMDVYAGNGTQLTKSPEEYLNWLKAAKASVVQFEGYA